MRYLLLFLLLSSTAPIIKDDKWNIPEQKALIQRQIWLDGCIVGVMIKLISAGYKQYGIDTIILVETCHEVVEARFNDLHL